MRQPNNLNNLERRGKPTPRLRKLSREKNEKIMTYRELFRGFFVLYVILCLLAIVFSGCDTVQEIDRLDEARLQVHKQAAFTPLALQPKANYTKADAHIDAVVRSIEAVDEGIAHCDYVIAHTRVFSLLAEMHKARADYLSVRAALLYHLYNLSPVDVYERGVLK